MYYAFRVAAKACVTCPAGAIDMQRFLLQPYLLGPHAVSNSSDAPSTKKYFLFIKSFVFNSLAKIIPNIYLSENLCVKV